MKDNFDLEDMRYFADKYRGKYKTSGPHWSLVIRFPILFDECVRLQKRVDELETQLTEIMRKKWTS